MITTKIVPIIVGLLLSSLFPTVVVNAFQTSTTIAVPTTTTAAAAAAGTTTTTNSKRRTRSLLLYSSSTTTQKERTKSSSNDSYYNNKLQKDVPYQEAQYDPHAAEEFYKDRPFQSFGRMAQIIAQSSSFITTTALMDNVVNKKKNNNNNPTTSSPAAVVDDDDDDDDDRQSQELLKLVSGLGPTFIKVGQALSTRTDLLPAKYAKGLTGLQDAVPPFSAALGRQVIESELNIDSIDTVFSELSLEPVASASIGQVYKGRLRKCGTQVAVKVQRPNVLSDVALDLHMLRSLAPLYQNAKDINTDLVGLVDAWGEGFVAELDYRAEANATMEFNLAMQERQLLSSGSSKSSVVFAPRVLEEYSSMHVLTTEWVDGERLVDSDASDVPRLCGVALNAYLTMLLDTGTLHCDPHPGNLLRTPDGRLCILDWGMTLEVPSDLQLSLLEFIANLNAENYEAIPEDLVKLQFVPKHKIDELRSSGLTVAIAKMLSLAAEGGGPKGAMKRMVAQNKKKYAEALAEFDDLDSKEATAVRQRLFQEDWKKSMAQDALSRQQQQQQPDSTTTTSTTMDVTTKIEEMQQQNADVFAIPDYFVYMSRAFSTLEGIGLSTDSNYSILQECYPYLAKRLLSSSSSDSSSSSSEEEDSRVRGALKTLLYGSSSGGGGGSSSNNNNGEEETDPILNLDKLVELSKGFDSYTASTSSVESSMMLQQQKQQQQQQQEMMMNSSSSSSNTNADNSGTIATGGLSDELANILLSEDSNYIQELLLRETAVALDATVRDALLPKSSPPNLQQLLDPFSLRTATSSSSFPPLPLNPFTLPLELAKASIELQSIDDRDQKRLDNVRIVQNLVSGGLNNNKNNKDTASSSSTTKSNNNNNIMNPRTIQTILREGSNRSKALTRMGIRLSGSLASIQAERLRKRSSSLKNNNNKNKSTTTKKRNGSSTTANQLLIQNLALQSADSLEKIANLVTSFDQSLTNSNKKK